MLKKNIAKLLVFAMLLSMLPFTAAADTTTQVNPVSGTADQADTGYLTELKAKVTANGTPTSDQNLTIAKPSNTNAPYTASFDVTLSEGQTTVSLDVSYVTSPDSGVTVVGYAGKNKPEEQGADGISAENGKVAFSNVSEDNNTLWLVATKVDGENKSLYYYKLTVNVVSSTPLTSVTISGTPKVGETLTATVAPADATVTYQWKADDADISGATEATYELTENEEGKTITVTAIGTGDYTGEVTSTATAAVVATGSTGDQHSVTVYPTPTEGGTATADCVEAAEGATVTVTITPNPGYELKAILKNGTADTLPADGKTYTFTMSNAAVTIEVQFAKIQYNVTVSETANGKVVVNPDKAEPGKEITVTATPDSGYKVESITAKTASGANVTVTNGKFTMPSENVIVTVTFAKLDEATYNVSVVALPTAGGTASAGVVTAKEGAEITVTFRANSDYEFVSITNNGVVVDPTEDGKYTFTMPAENVLVEVTF